MLISKLIHPSIMAALAQCGHGDVILISDGNYPLDSKVNKETEKVYLALTPNLPKVTDVLAALKTQINFESAKVMIPPKNFQEPEIYKEFKSILAIDNLEEMDPLNFYKECQTLDNLKLAINTGETRLYANILLTVGVA